MTYDLATTDALKLVQKQSLNGGKKLTLKSTLPRKHISNKTYILADISGSMSGDRLHELKKALHKVWRPGIHGIAFGSLVYDFTEADIDSLAVIGTTNMLDALLAGWEDTASHMVLLTDGQPDQSESTILNEVNMHTDIPIDTIGIGLRCNNDFLQRISEITGGKFNSINEPLMLTEVMEDLLRIAETGTSGCINL